MLVPTNFSQWISFKYLHLLFVFGIFVEILSTASNFRARNTADTSTYKFLD